MRGKVGEKKIRERMREWGYMKDVKPEGVCVELLTCRMIIKTIFLRTIQVFNIKNERIRKLVFASY